MEESKERNLNFIEEIIESDLESGKFPKGITTRFPPEPNGFLHIGHAKSICLNFGLTKHYQGKTNLRFDDTNPSTEETRYVDSIKEDIQWLGFQWDAEFYASDYFDKLFDYAKVLIHKNLAYVDFSSAEQMAEEKGTPTKPGKPNHFRITDSKVNLEHFEKMAKGEYPEGTCVLRAKIDLNSSNMLMRDPIIYRIKFAHHHRTGDQWCIYPMYDFAHGQSDSIENITHSICTLEFVSHRELYDWFIAQLDIFPSKQYEFARLNMTNTVMSKRKLLTLVNDGIVEAWDDPRMPTISGMRRRGYPASAIRDFCERIGIQKRDNLIDLSLLEFFVREYHNKNATRVMAVFDPIKVEIVGVDEDYSEICTLDNNPEIEGSGSRTLPFTKYIFIEREDFMEDPPPKYFRLSVGGMVRLKGAYIIQCESVEKDELGKVILIRCSIVPNSKSGNDTSGAKVKGVIHWLPCKEAVDAKINLYDRLFLQEDMNAFEGDFKDALNPGSLKVINAKIEPYLVDDAVSGYFQFIRNGYFVKDQKSTSQALIFNKTVGLKESFK
ncbi:MAG: glutamine--tRNA ligase/YqeY domain fusion protein [Leadbetterella sp.]